jgi:beta-phosphoglucomutase-like phosphatase (HAD superfamily)
MKFKAVIFDMDGLLLDSQRIATEAYIAAFKQMGLKADMALYYQCVGTNVDATRKIMVAGLEPDFPLDEMFGLWEENYIAAAILKPVPVKTGACELLTFLSDQKIPCAVATSTEHQYAVTKLTNANIYHFFDHISAGDHVASSKPDPEIYRLAADRLEIDPIDCLALEDSDNGVRAAHGAGMTVIQIPDIVDPKDEILMLGHQIASSLHDILTQLKSR